MRRIFVLLLTLAFLPTLCLAGSIDNFNVTNYQINITATWIETNPSCVLNCTETMNLNYEFELNLDAFNQNSPTLGIYGWVPLNTMQVSASGFLGSFSLENPHIISRVWSIPTLWVDNEIGGPFDGGMPFEGTGTFPFTDEIDLGNPGPGLPGQFFLDQFQSGVYVYLYVRDR